MGPGRGGAAAPRPLTPLLEEFLALHEWVYHDRNHIGQIMENARRCLWPALGNAQKFYA